MNTENLVVMVNRIGEFFEVMSDKEEGLCGVATHLKKFWEPRMRRALKQHLDDSKGEGLKPFVLEALKKHESKWL
jgi:formate dehydrogenase delta subunit (EC 1.2.1.2)